ncbi:hypothetical protein Taro_047650 [Colocasia esculenta]|uniref:Uncharacterized protein n=1 Tax=Colocasia esculenta TaxID=4460 RepID=A0A843X6V1_COLES|nr:hypothetical protein [Colocasia esculenta]
MRKEVHSISRELEWYNQLVGHVEIHGQRRFTEALEKKATRVCAERDKGVRTGREIATGRSSRSECDGFAVVTRP